MKILFFISLLTHGRGGHLYSLFHIANRIASKHEVEIVSIGPGDNTTISNHPNYLCHVDLDGKNLIQFKRKMDHIIEDFSPNIVHCFDVTSFNIIKPLYISKNFNIVLTKCGGSNPKFFPYVKNLILFSVENKRWFESNNRYKKSNIALIPNRVSKITTEFSDIKRSEEFFTFVKIARIGITYKQSILHCINLIDELYRKDKSLKIRLFIIGVVESEEILLEISNSKYVLDGTVVILTDDKYTRNASKMLYLADAAIATGRGVMESASLGIPTLTGNSLSSIPMLITMDTFEDGFKTNFSGRNVFSEKGNKDNLLNIQRVIVDPAYRTEISEYMKSIFEENFNVENSLAKYEDFYISLVGENNGKRKFFQDSLFGLKSLRNFHKNSIIKK